jgi:hypothetical protein
MGVLTQLGILGMLAAIGAGTAPVQAEETVATCSAPSALHARALADEASRTGEHHRAAVCYLEAGDALEADRAFAKAFAVAQATSTKRASATLDEAKAQARRVRAAFRRSDSHAR